MPDEYFKTSFGDLITIVPGLDKKLYHGFYRKTEVNAWLERCPESDIPRWQGNKVEFDDMRSDLYGFALLIDFMEELNLLYEDPFDRVLDIGGREGIHAALFRGHFARHADVADILDGRNSQLGKMIKAEYKKRYRKHQIADRLMTYHKWTRFLFRLFYPNFNDLARLNPGRYNNIPSYHNYFNFNFQREPNVDNYIIGDCLKAPIEEDAYDVVLTFESFYLFDATTAIPRVASFLKKGKFFAGLFPYAWNSLSTYGLSGDFAFFEQRLILEDICKYYEIYKPEIRDSVEQLYYAIDPNRPTIRQYIDLFLDNGMILKGYKRLFQKQPYCLASKHRFRNHPLTESNIDTQHGNEEIIVVDADEVLANIARFRKDVKFEDLMTKGVLMVFEKAI
jgi:hypothetical protein|tara:strand:+ start:3517 stop:4695 length:1179 start_codon:yes stop_codon:yes gene_type:complete